MQSHATNLAGFGSCEGLLSPTMNEVTVVDTK